MEIGRRVQYVSGPRTSCGCGAYGRRSSGNLGDEYSSNLRVSAVCSLLVRLHGSHA